MTWYTLTQKKDMIHQVLHATTKQSHTPKPQISTNHLTQSKTPCWIGPIRECNYASSNFEIHFSFGLNFENWSFNLSAQLWHACSCCSGWWRMLVLHCCSFFFLFLFLLNIVVLFFWFTHFTPLCIDAEQANLSFAKFTHTLLVIRLIKFN